MTFNGLAMAGTGGQYQHRLNSRITGKGVAEHLSLKPVRTSRGLIYPASLGFMCLDAIDKFCKTSDEEISINHIPMAEKEGMNHADQTAIRHTLLPFVKKLWKDMIDKNGQIPISHSVYVKVWALSNPVIDGFDYAIFDEGQDADEIMIEIMNSQNFPVFWLGDRWQQIYAWRGAVNALDKVDVSHSLALTQSFRFGQGIADQANILLNFMGEPKRIKGNPDIKSSVQNIEHPDAIICRTNAQCIKEGIAYIAKNSKGNILIPGLFKIKPLFDGVEKLMKGERPIGELSLFTNWSELVDYSESNQGGDLSLLVKIVKEHGISYIQEFVRKQEARTNSESGNEKEVVITTAHRSKGLEYHKVMLSDDFKMPDQKKMPGLEEFRLLYVAMTRAKYELDITNVDMHKIRGKKYNHSESGVQISAQVQTKDAFYKKQIRKLKNN